MLNCPVVDIFQLLLALCFLISYVQSIPLSSFFLMCMTFVFVIRMFVIETGVSYFFAWYELCFFEVLVTNCGEFLNPLSVEFF